MALIRTLLSSLLVGACAAAGGCATKVQGSAQPADSLGPTRTTTTAPTPALVPAGKAADKLLKRSELASIVADTDMKEVAGITGPEQNKFAFDPIDCGDRVRVGEPFGLPSALVGNENLGARGQITSQVISIWPDRQQSRDSIDTAAVDWGICTDNQPITSSVCSVTYRCVSLFDGVKHWTSGTITVNQGPSRISTTSQRQEPPPYACSHVMAAQANVVVDTAACGDGDTLAAANQIADRILAKVPQ